MRGNNGVKFFLVIAIIAILTWIAATGPTILGTKIGGFWDINKGIDIRGGVRATLSAPEGKTPTAEQMASLTGIIRKRLGDKGLFDVIIQPEKNNTRLAVEIPWKQNETEYNANKLIDDTIQTALLTFQEVDETKVDKDLNFLPTGKIILQGTHVKDAKYESNPNTNQAEVSLTLSSEGADKFAEATGRLVGKRIAIFLDDKPVLDSDNSRNSHAPVVNGQIIGGNAVITGQKDAKAAGEFAALIRSGALPFNLIKLQSNTISSELGENAFNVTVLAMGAAIILVWLFMFFYYRLMGLLANIALLAHTVIQLLFISWMGISVTLPGMAGIILTIGMGVDANIIIFERIKEELRNGKTLRAAIDVGFKRAFTAVLDANMTTLIAAVVLYMFNSGPIKSFAITLGLGVALSFLTAVVVSRIMLKAVSDLDIAKHPWLYGVSMKAKVTKEVKA